MSDETTKIAAPGTLRSLKEISGYKIAADDGVLGRVDDCLFDDQNWGIRYLVANTSALFGREILLFTTVAGVPDWTTTTIPVSLTKKQVKESPPVDLDKPVSRQHVAELHQYYGWPMAWDLVPPAPLGNAARPGDATSEVGDPHLRSVQQVTGYGIQAADGSIGHVEDFIAEIESWMIRYLVIDTRNWLPGRKVLLAPAWVEKVDWLDRKVYLGATREIVKNSPKFDSSQPVNREYEARLHDYYGRPVYWD